MELVLYKLVVCLGLLCIMYAARRINAYKTAFKKVAKRLELSSKRSYDLISAAMVQRDQIATVRNAELKKQLKKEEKKCATKKN